MVRLNESQPSPQNQPVSPTVAQPPIRPRRRNFYFLVGLIAIVAVFSAFAFAYLMPKGEAATVQLGINYTVGEKMTYQYTLTISAMGQTVPQNGTMTLEVLDFDGENYTLRETMKVSLQQYSYTVKMNKTGYISDYEGLSPELQQTFGAMGGMSGFGMYFQKEEMEVGESFQIPFGVQTDSFSFAGLYIFRISEVKNVTVPAGTYNAFRMDSTGFVFGSFGFSSETMSTISGSMNGYGYTEVGTGRQIEYHMDMQVSASAMSMSVSMSMKISLILTEDIRP
jgi:hypothetical protein